MLQQVKVNEAKLSTENEAKNKREMNAQQVQIMPVKHFSSLLL